VIKTLVFGPGFFYGIITDMQETKYVYESPDGGETVYRRRIGVSGEHREIHSISPRQKDLYQGLQRSKLWGNIHRESENDPVLKDLLDRVEIYYRMKYDAKS